MRTCISCGTSIEERHGTAKRCIDCAKAALIDQSKKFRESNPNYAKEWHAKASVEYFDRQRARIASARHLSPAKKENGKYRVTRAKYMRRIADELTDCYVAGELGLNLSNCPPELIQMKRERILMHRALRELNKTLKEQNGN